MESTELDFDFDDAPDDGDISFIDDDIDFASDDDVQTTRNLSQPVRFAARARKREYINGLKKQALTDLVKELPDADTDLYILSNGSGGSYRQSGDPVAFEFGHFIPVLASMMGLRDGTFYLSTWTMNRAHSLNILNQFDTGVFGRMGVMTDPYFLRRESSVANALVMGLLQRRQRFVAFKNHVKALAMATKDETRCVVVTGSANLSSQPRAENFVLSTNPALYQWLKTDFFEVMLNAS